MNVEWISRQMDQKNGYTPYSPNPEDIFKVRTDVNEFPYQRFFRGERTSDRPHVWEREAGFSPLLSKGYGKGVTHFSPLWMENSSTPFQVACSTQFPASSTVHSIDNSTMFESSRKGCVYRSP